MLVFLSGDGKIMFWSDSGLVRFISIFVIIIMLMIKNGIFKERVCIDTKEKRGNAVAYSLLNDPSTRLTEIVTASGLM